MRTNTLNKYAVTTQPDSTFVFTSQIEQYMYLFFSSFWPSSVTVSACCCQIWSETRPNPEDRLSVDITVDNYAAFFNCTPVGRASDSMMVPT